MVDGEWWMLEGGGWRVADGWCADTSLLSSFAVLFKVLQE